MIAAIRSNKTLSEFKASRAIGSLGTGETATKTDNSSSIATCTAVMLKPFFKILEIAESQCEETFESSLEQTKKGEMSSHSWIQENKNLSSQDRKRLKEMINADIHKRLSEFFYNLLPIFQIELLKKLVQSGYIHKLDSVDITRQYQVRDREYAPSLLQILLLYGEDNILDILIKKKLLNSGSFFQKKTVYEQYYKPELIQRLIEFPSGMLLCINNMKEWFSSMTDEELKPFLISPTILHSCFSRMLIHYVDDNSSVPPGKWSDFEAIINRYPDYLFQQESKVNSFQQSSKENSVKGLSPFIYVASSTRAQQWFKERWGFFKAIIAEQPDRLFDQVTFKVGDQGVSSFHLICNRSSDYFLLKMRWSFFEPIIQANEDRLFDQITTDCSSRGETAFYMLCSHQAGCELITNNWEFFKPIIEKNSIHLFDKVTADGKNKGSFPLYQLCNSISGKKLIAANIWDFLRWGHANRRLFEERTMINNQEFCAEDYFKPELQLQKLQLQPLSFFNDKEGLKQSGAAAAEPRLLKPN
jgi:hypothetical protein